MRLTELEPQFVRYENGPNPSGEGESEFRHYVENIDEAQGVWFLCPVCFKHNGGAVGTHLIEASFADRGVKDNQGSHNREGQPSRWSVRGIGYGDLTLLPSILIDAAPPACSGWHGFVTNGEVS